MELKFRFCAVSFFACFVLIIPYGIEICLSLQYNYHELVLIIPYGIEIIRYISLYSLTFKVLIIPYGIEIR